MLWFNGKLVSGAQMDATSAAISLGWGVFSTVGVREGAPMWLQKHLRRLNRDAQMCGVENPFCDDEIEAGLRATIAANQIQNGVARLTLTKRGDGRWNARDGSDFSILALETPILNSSLRVGVDFHPHSRHHPFCGAKTTSYLPFFALWQNAQKSGWDEVLLHNDAKIVVEAARSTPFWARNGELFTPSLDLGGLRGVGREIVGDWAAKNRVLVREGAFLLEEIENADEFFLISGASGPRAVEIMVSGAEFHFSSREFCPQIHNFWRSGKF